MIAGTIFTDPVFTDITIRLGVSVPSAVIKLDNLKLVGFFSLQYRSSGGGSLKFEYLLSNDGVNFYPEDNAAPIVSGVINAHGFIFFQPACSLYMIIVATEIGGTLPAVANATLCIQ